MIYTKHGVRCERCFKAEGEALVGRRVDVQDAVLSALSIGPRTLKQIAEGVYGSAAPEHRRKVTWILRNHRDVVERIAPSTWALRTHAEAAE